MPPHLPNRSTRAISPHHALRIAAALSLAFGTTGCRTSQQNAGTTAATIAAPAAPLAYLNGDLSAFQSLLPPHPAQGSPLERCEIQAILIAQAEVPVPTRARVKLEEALTPALLDQAAGRPITGAATPLTFAILTKALADTRVISNQVKASFNRPRPSTIDPRITLLVALPTNSSYPSGHATLAIVWARLLGELAPAHAADLEHRAQLIAWDRIVAGVHFPSDVAAGAELGEAIAARMLANPALRADLAAARSEWPQPAP